jgi:beta-lactamase regulating signal transducer with metallopeptidase domain
MSALVIDTPLPALVTLAAKATLLMALAAVAVLFSRRLSASARHWTITLAICGLLALPLLSGVLPSWTVLQVQATAAMPAMSPDLPESPLDDPAEQAASATATSAPSVRPTSAGSTSTFWQVLTLAYAIGAVGLLTRLALQFAAARRLARRSGLLDDRTWESLLREGAAALGIRGEVRLLRGAAASMPMALGTWQAAIVLPSVVDEWSLDRRRAVLLHELAHVARRDCLTQLLAGIACAVYWPHPGVWWLARRLRVERELASDDLVLGAGTPPTDYAGHLLDVAYTLGGSPTTALAVGMARRSHLEGRMLAVLDAARNRALPGRRLRLATAAVAMLSVVSLAVATVTSEPLLPADVDPRAEPGLPAASEPATVAATRALEPQLKQAPWARAAASLARQAAGAVHGSGSWNISPTRTPGEVHLEMREGRSQSGRTVKLASLEGLSEAQLSGSGPVTFVVRRDAGTFTFEGTARNGHAGGTFSFAASQSFPGELEKRGVGRPTAEQQYDMARHDVGLALIDELQRRGYARPTVADLVEAGHHGVHVDYVREMAELGYALGTLEPLITLRDHGVTPGFVRGLASHGFTKIPADEVRRARDHGVTPEFIGELKALGFGNLALAEFVRVRDHGVTPAYVSAMRALGYASESLDALVNARNHGVTPEFVKGLSDLGYSGLPLQDVVRTRDHGVTPEYVREMHALGHKAQLTALVTARDHGVTPGYARELKALGYDALMLDELIMLRDLGVTPDKARRANEKAGTRLPADMLRSLANSGWK